jgi:hypothetical protein
MAKPHSTRAQNGANLDTELRDGALECIAAVRELLKSAQVPCGDRAEDYFNKRHEDAKAFAAKFGPLPQYVEGAITALAEIIHCMETTGDPNLDVWLPCSAQTDEERAADIAAMEISFAGSKAVAECKVIPLRPTH